MKNVLIALAAFIFIFGTANAQTFLTPEMMKFYTADWTGERS